MRFRLTYSGPLRPNQRDPLGTQPDKLAEHKQDIRKVFHCQLKRLWETNKFLREHKLNPHSPVFKVSPAQSYFGIWAKDSQKEIPMVEAVALNYQQFGYRFVPLVREDVSLLCSLNILFLRRDIPGSVINVGDLDNRIKTLVDTLRRPMSIQELRGNEQPAAGEDPFFCLLEDDKLVTHLTIETDTLLDPPRGTAEDGREVKLVITVELKPNDVTMFNLGFA
jgi:hypothetical protein